MKGAYADFIRTHSLTHSIQVGVHAKSSLLPSGFYSFELPILNKANPFHLFFILSLYLSLYLCKCLYLSQLYLMVGLQQNLNVSLARILQVTW